MSAGDAILGALPDDTRGGWKRGCGSCYRAGDDGRREGSRRHLPCWIDALRVDRINIDCMQKGGEKNRIAFYPFFADSFFGIAAVRQLELKVKEK